MEMCFEANPFFFLWRMMLRQLRPASRGVHYGAGGVCFVRRLDVEDVSLLNFAHGHGFLRMGSGFARGVQQRHV